MFNLDKYFRFISCIYFLFATQPIYAATFGVIDTITPLKCILSQQHHNRIMLRN